MVQITNFKKATSEDGKEFFALLLQGEVEAIQSKATGRYYLTARTCSIPSTFNETSCKALIGKKLPGRIIKVECEAYEYTLPSGEKVELSHSWLYDAEAKTVEENVFEEELK
jgi:hypothetical protein